MYIAIGIGGIRLAAVASLYDTVAESFSSHELRTELVLDNNNSKNYFTQLEAEKKEISLVWSFMHEDENILCPFIERKLSVVQLSTLCNKKIGPEEEILTLAKEFQQKAYLSSKDTIHIACANYVGCRYFITCDEVLLKRSKRLNLDMEIMNPVDYIREVVK
ncbi:MAG: hypothetical protein SCARUB_02330 [Candidatus Scalindua rubra]|uniref:PIN domain-containing protein n=1 Tax=Candidatus Scalindua rubra TaxID=1872076 RepID=A0A1E3XAA5_9BACT|nr:MAG: hypothetical protein SCARUB_02330 [Candidatus Scalindua rubra]